MSALEHVHGLHAVQALLERDPARVVRLHVAQAREDTRVAALLAGIGTNWALLLGTTKLESDLPLYMFPVPPCKEHTSIIVTAIKVNTKLQRELDWNLFCAATTRNVDVAFELIVQGANVAAADSGGGMRPSL